MVELMIRSFLKRLLIDREFIEQLMNTQTPDEVSALFDAKQAEGEAKEKENETKDALKKKALEMGVNIRVETNGSEGAKNVLTPDEIRRASGVIVAAAMTKSQKRNLAVSAVKYIRT